jgi:hypothetical protein
MLEKIIWNLEQLKAIHKAEVENSRDNPYWLRKHNEAKEKLVEVESKLGIYLKMLPPVPVKEPEVMVEEKPKKPAVPRKKKPVQAKEVVGSPKKKAPAKKKISVSKQ